MSRSPERTMYGISFVAVSDFSALQSACPPIPLMVRSAKMIDGRNSLARASAAAPSATTSDFSPLRCNTREIRRATCGSSSTMRIIARDLSAIETNAHAFAQMRERSTGECAADVREGVGDRHDARRQKRLPKRQPCGENDSDDQRDDITARSLLAIEQHEGEKSPRHEQECIRKQLAQRKSRRCLRAS